MPGFVLPNLVLVELITERVTVLDAVNHVPQHRQFVAIVGTPSWTAAQSHLRFLRATQTLPVLHVLPWILLAGAFHILRESHQGPLLQHHLLHLDDTEITQPVLAVVPHVHILIIHNAMTDIDFVGISHGLQKRNHDGDDFCLLVGFVPALPDLQHPEKRNIARLIDTQEDVSILNAK